MATKTTRRTTTTAAKRTAKPKVAARAKAKPEARASAPKPPRAPRAAKAAAYCVVDHPTRGETLHAGHYAVRVGASHDAAEVSIDEGPWMPCRASAGYHWYDWEAPPGEHVLLARTVDADGKTTRTSVPVSCIVTT